MLRKIKTVLNAHEMRTEGWCNYCSNYVNLLNDLDRATAKVSEYSYTKIQWLRCEVQFKRNSARTLCCTYYMSLST